MYRGGTKASCARVAISDLKFSYHLSTISCSSVHMVHIIIRVCFTRGKAEIGYADTRGFGEQKFMYIIGEISGGGGSDQLKGRECPHAPSPK